MMWDFGGHYGAGFGLFGGIFMIFWWVLIIGGIIALVRWVSMSSCSRNGSCGHAKQNESDANASMNILKERYARGEIDDEEFEKKKKILSQS